MIRSVVVPCLRASCESVSPGWTTKERHENGGLTTHAVAVGGGNVLVGAMVSVGADVGVPVGVLVGIDVDVAVCVLVGRTVLVSVGAAGVVGLRVGVAPAVGVWPADRVFVAGRGTVGVEGAEVMVRSGAAVARTPDADLRVPSCMVNTPLPSIVHDRTARILPPIMI